MSNENLNNSNKEKNELIKNNPFLKIYHNQLTNSIEKKDIKESKISKSFNQSKNIKEISNQKKKLPFSKILNLDKDDKKQLNNIIILIYNELISIINDIDNVSDDYTPNINLINNKEISLESILNILRNTFIKIIDEKLKLFKENIKQYKSRILLLEQSNRFYIQQIFLKQTKIDILENEIESYMDIEAEFEEMKEKLKYENGKFLHNEKKENEILILRAENSNLKKIIDKNEKTIEEKELLIESFKKKSASIVISNKNTMKNSFDMNEQPSTSPSPLIFIKQNHKHNQIKQRQNLSNNNSNITSFKKINSPTNKYNYKTNNNFNSSKNIQIKKISCGDTSNYLKNKKNSSINSKINTKEILSKKIKNKVLNMKKIRRINDSCLDNYNKSSVHITNSIMSNNSNSSSKRIRKNINSYIKKNKNELSDRINYLHKKLSSRLINSNFHNNDSRYINNLIKNSNNNKIIVNSILNNNNDRNSINKINNKSFLMKTSDKKFYLINKKNNKAKTKLKQHNDKFILERNNYSLLKNPNTFNTNDFDNSIRMKNNIIINNIIQNSPDVPSTISGSREKNISKDKINIA